MKKRQALTPCQSEQLAWDRELWKATGLAIGQWLTDAAINLNRPIRSLTLTELTGMSWAAIGRYNDLTEQRARELADRPAAGSSVTDI